MIIAYIKRLLIKNKEFILREVLEIKDLMRLLMKVRNTGEPWTKEEKKELKKHLRGIFPVIPALIIFALPGGSLLLPFLAEILDRRKAKRQETQKQETTVT